MVSVNSSSNAWSNWQARNAPPPTETAPTPVTAPGSTGEGTGTSAGAVNANIPQVTITDATAPALVYSAPAVTPLGQNSVSAAASLSNMLDQQGFFTASASQGQPDAPQQTPSATLPEVLTQAEVIARAAYTLVSEAGANNPAASLMEQFG